MGKNLQQNRTGYTMMAFHIDKNAKLGKNVNIHNGVVIYDNVIIGNRVTVRANAVLGSEGMEIRRDKDGILRRIPHKSLLIIEDSVDIGNSTTVQKGVLRPTKIGEGTKIGPNCDVGHQVNIGKHCIITGMTFIGGSAEIGDFTYIGPHSTIGAEMKIGSRVNVRIGSLVLHDIPDNTTVAGRPAIEIGRYKCDRKKMKAFLERFSIK